MSRTVQRYSAVKCSVWFLCLGWFCAVVRCNQDQSMAHCAKNLFPILPNATHMQFTKEVIATEYAILGDFKSLHCCAKGFRSIEWMKDGKPYPWLPDESSLILYPEASNQTIYTRNAQAHDVGNYTCVVRNDTIKITRDISLTAQGNLPDCPLATYHPQHVFAELGTEARFYCEAFVGKVGLPDAKSEISWYQILKDDVLEEVDEKTETVLRENGQTIGSFMRIPKVEVHHYGRYMCRVQFGSAAHRLEMKTTLSGNPIEANPSLMGLYHTIAAVLSAIVAAFIVIAVWYLIRPRCTRHSEKNKCQETNNDAIEDFSGPQRV